MVLFIGHARPWTERTISIANTSDGHCVTNPVFLFCTRLKPIASLRGGGLCDWILNVVSSITVMIGTWDDLCHQKRSTVYAMPRRLLTSSADEASRNWGAVIKSARFSSLVTKRANVAKKWPRYDLPPGLWRLGISQKPKYLLRLYSFRMKWASDSYCIWVTREKYVSKAGLARDWLVSRYSGEGALLGYLCFPLSINGQCFSSKESSCDESIRCIMRLVSTGQDGAVVRSRLTAGWVLSNRLLGARWETVNHAVDKLAQATSCWRLRRVALLQVSSQSRVCRARVHEWTLEPVSGLLACCTVHTYVDESTSRL